MIRFNGLWRSELVALSQHWPSLNCRKSTDILTRICRLCDLCAFVAKNKNSLPQKHKEHKDCDYRPEKLLQHFLTFAAIQRKEPLSNRECEVPTELSQSFFSTGASFFR